MSQVQDADVVIRDGNDFIAMPSDPPETLEKGLCATEKYPPGRIHVLQLIWVRISKTLLLSFERIEK